MAMPAMADDAPQAGVITIPLPLDETLTVRGLHGSIAVVPTNGDPPRIDWAGVESAATSANHDPITRGVARALLAVRDGTWVAMEGGKP